VRSCPQDTPPAILAGLRAAEKAAGQGFVSAMTKLGEPGFASAREFSAYWPKERKWIGEIVRRVGLSKSP
jgi:hypothetical protein